MITIDNGLCLCVHLPLYLLLPQQTTSLNSLLQLYLSLSDGIVIKFTLLTTDMTEHD